MRCNAMNNHSNFISLRSVGYKDLKNECMTSHGKMHLKTKTFQLDPGTESVQGHILGVKLWRCRCHALCSGTPLRLREFFCSHTLKLSLQFIFVQFLS